MPDLGSIETGDQALTYTVSDDDDKEVVYLARVSSLSSFLSCLCYFSNIIYLYFY
jgi:hypothetical protein